MLQLLSKNMNNVEDLKNRKKFKLEKLRKSLSKLEEAINYQFKNKNLAIEALTHKSFYPQKPISISEKLEFLGDSVLELTVTEAIYKAYPGKTEGELTKLRSKIISSNFLYAKSVKFNLAKFIITDRSISPNELKKNKSISANAMESLFGAIFLDSSFVEAKYVIKNIVLKDVNTFLQKSILKNYKSKLQEISHKKFHKAPAYSTKKVKGPDHNRKFYIEVEINNEYRATGKGKSKKRAEQRAAKHLIKKIKKL